MKKILLITIGIILVNIFILNVAIAGTSCETHTDCKTSGEICLNVEKDPKKTAKMECVKAELKDYKFDTGENLNMGSTDQGQAYFKDENPIVNFILRIINFALRIMGALAVVILIIGGFMMMVSQGNEQQLTAGRDTVKYAAIGLIVAFLSYIIVIFVQSLFVTKEAEEAGNPAPAAFILEKNEKFI